MVKEEKALHMGEVLFSKRKIVAFLVSHEKSAITAGMLIHPLLLERMYYVQERSPFFHRVICFFRL
jgi:hypothetical protein